jgi:DNA-binding transcriptional regulator GbsR (MarR family)
MKQMTASDMGRKGGSSKSPRKIAASLKNLRKANAAVKALTRAKRLA